MKKKLCFCLAICISLAFLLPCFFAAKNTAKKEAAAVDIESEYKNSNSVDLISANIDNTSGIVDGSLDVAPFNRETKTSYEGNSISPTAGEYGEFKGKEFPINGGLGYTPETNDAVYMWIYLLNMFSYKLKISLLDGSGNNLTWELSQPEIMSMGSGWKFVQLNLLDFSNLSFDYTEKTYSTISFSYYSEVEDTGEMEGDVYKLETKTSERFSFYHVFASKDVDNKNSSGMIYDQPKSYFEYNDSFDIDGNVFVGDRIKINSAKDIFKSLYVGKYNLSNYTTDSRYYWSISIQSPSSNTKRIEFGDYINFYEQGYYNLTIQLHETGSTDVILNASLQVYCDELVLGRFNMNSDYTINDNESVVISFKLTNNIIIDKDSLKLKTSNENVTINSFEEENGVMYIHVSGVSAGTSSLEIMADVTSKNGTKTKAVNSVATINVQSTKKGIDIFNVILWATFACFCSGIVIYLSISLVKSRKNDVK